MTNEEITYEMVQNAVNVMDEAEITMPVYVITISQLEKNPEIFEEFAEKQPCRFVIMKDSAMEILKVI